MALDRKTLVIAGIAALVATGGAAIAAGGRHDDMRMGVGPMMGPGMALGPRFCEAKEPVAPRIAGRIETTLKPTDAQRGEFDALKAAMEKAETALKAACPTEAERADRTPTARLALAEKGMAAGLDALRTVRPPFDTLYAKLDDRQRDALRWSGRDGGWMRGGPHR